MLTTIPLNRSIFRHPNARWVLYGLIFTWALGVLTYWKRPQQVFSSAKWVDPVGHPIERLITEKRSYFEALLSRQSKTLADAITEYKRRYGREPPAGFEWWYRLATKNGFQLVDEFDVFMESMEPYRGISPYILQKRMDMVQTTAPDRAAAIYLRDGEVEIDNSNNFLDIKHLPNRTHLERIPYNVTVLLNGFDEPVVVADNAEVQDAMAAIRSGKHIDFSDADSELVVEPLLDSGRQSGWAAQAQACSYKSPSRQVSCPKPPRDGPLPFQNNITAGLDVCQNCQLLHQHGMLLRPDTMKTARQLIPIFSASKPSHFHDLLYPSLYYSGTTKDYKPDEDPEFQEKDNKFYWVGKATGGQVTEDNWYLMQRQRLALKCRTQNSEMVQVLEESRPGRWTPFFVPMANIVKEFFQVHISGVCQCKDDWTCNISKAAFDLVGDTENTDPKEEAYKHKFIMDIDGNGFSGRFYRLLQSKSVVVKQTILKEWHDDRLVPWVHYVPLSTGYDELPELARFLAGTERGLELSERIASESAKWHNTALRDVDMQLYTLRTFLEFGRMMSGEP